MLLLESFEAAPRVQSSLQRDVLIEGRRVRLTRTGTSGLSRRRNKAEPAPCNDHTRTRLE
jgi:hypothetical protein